LVVAIPTPSSGRARFIFRRLSTTGPRRAGSRCARFAWDDRCDRRRLFTYARRAEDVAESRVRIPLVASL